jgi:small subunit ribosomal protein S14
MARKAMIEKSKRKPKFKVRVHNRCGRCGRSRAFLRRFGLCRICFRELSLQGMIPGVSQIHISPYSSTSNSDTRGEQIQP